jgi:hypothetical protein
MDMTFPLYIHSVYFLQRMHTNYKVNSIHQNNSNGRNCIAVMSPSLKSDSHPQNIWKGTHIGHINIYICILISNIIYNIDHVYTNIPAPMPNC